MSTRSATLQPPQSRVIVLCFDGTSNQYCDANTNVVKLYALLDKRSPLEQLVYYQPGIGTYVNPGAVSPALTWLAKKADLAVAWYLNDHIMGGYKFLMQNYREGDKICLFGFSRGAYTARALEGFLHKIGLLPRDNDEQVPFAYHLYKRTDDEGKRLAKGFKKTFCTPITVEFLGVWDTVASVGMIFNRAPPLTFSHKAAKIARHALSLDERRARFQPSLFVRNAGGCGELTPANHEDTSNRDSRVRTSIRLGLEEFMKWSRRHSLREELQPGPGASCERPVNTDVPDQESESAAPSSDVEPVLEVWFPGCHSDVGGSAVDDTDHTSLSDTSLRWMVKHIIASKCGIKFDEEGLRQANIDGPTQSITGGNEAGAAVPALHTLPSSPVVGLGPGGFSMPMDEEDILEKALDRVEDDTASTHDELKKKPGWWVLEFLPTLMMRRQTNGTWKSKWRINRGRGRKILVEGPLFHVSVEERKNHGYKPKATWIGNERYVD